MKKSTKISLISLFSIVLLLIVGFFAIRAFNHNHEVNVVIDYISDFDNTKNVIGFAGSVFVGKVTKNLGTIKNPKELGDGPHTKFSVDILYNIKGNLSGNIDIIQMGGYSKFGTFYNIRDSELPTVGGVYLFATKGDIHQVNTHRNGSHLLFNATSLDDDEIRELIKNDEKVAEFRDAYIDEDPTIGVEGADFSGPTSYKNLSKSEKEAFENFDNGFVD